MEEWRWAVGYEGDYEVSNLGRVRSHKRGTPVIMRLGKYAGRARYLTLTLQTHGGGERNEYAHRLVLNAFVGPLPPGMVTRHLDGNPHNNALTNLRYGSPQENYEDQLRHGTCHSAYRTHCNRGHLLPPQTPPGVRRRCLTCKAKTQAKRNATRRAQRAAARSPRT